MGRVVLSAAILAVAAGCSSKPALVAVSGTVTVAGKPAPGTGVAFWPADPSTPLTNFNNGIVFTDESGKFTHGSRELGTGFAPGEYKLTFTRVVDKSGRPAPLEKPGEDGVKESLPAVYLDREKTPVVVVLSVPSAELDLAIAPAVASAVKGR